MQGYFYKCKFTIVNMVIYLDNAATTKVYPEVVEEMGKMFLDNFENPSSQHSGGVFVRERVEASRKFIADFLGCTPEEIFFTSGGTESDNLAIRGLAKANPDKKHIITSVIEHPAVLETCRDLEGVGYRVDYIGVGKDGLINLKDVEEKICKDTLVVSIMHVNNEIGTIQPIEEIAKVCRERGVYFHTDAVQGFAKVDLDLSNVDLISVSGHKVHGPKGIGFLYVRKGTNISALQTGGGQESGLRSGTENSPGIVGLAKALERLDDKEKLRESRDKIIEGLLKIPGTKINGSLDSRVYHNVNVSFYGIEGESLMLLLSEEGIFCSTGSACSSTKLMESHVLKAIGVEDLYIHGSLRLTLGEDVFGREDFVVEKIREMVDKLREMSPFKLNIPKDN